MQRSSQPLPDRVYGALLRLLPFDFRSEFGSDMEEAFYQQRLETAREQGLGALFRMWWDTIADLLRMAPREHLTVLSQDVRYALRMMRQNLAYTATATLILALGIGANTAVFSAVNAILLKPLPYTSGDNLVVIRQNGGSPGLDAMGFSVPEIEDYRRESRSLNGLVEYHSMVFTLLGGDESHRVRAGVVSANFFDLFGVQPLLGRTFAAGDERPGAPAVLVLSYEYWKRSEGGDPNIIGRMFQMNDQSHRVIGVLPPIPQYPRENDVYMPTSACPFRSRPANVANRNYRLMTGLFGRMKPGETLEHCRADLAHAAGNMPVAHPESYSERTGFRAGASNLRDELTQGARPMLFILMGASALVLLIACANVANLILARTTNREQELVIRSAVGAGSGRLLRQLLTENLILALLAAGVGLLFAEGSMALLTRFAGQLTPRAREIAIDMRVLAFAILCAGVTTLAFGSAAALHSRKDVAWGFVSWALKEGSRASAERRRSVVRRALIASQVAFSFVLLVGAGLMVRSLNQLSRVDPGYIPQRVNAVGFELNWSKYNTDHRRREIGDQLLAKVRARPGVISASLASNFPMDPDLTMFGRESMGLLIEGDSRREADLPPAQSMRAISPGYFQTLGIPMFAGRAFADSDSGEAPPVVVVNRRFASAVWEDRNPIGQRISFNQGRLWLRVVGIAGDTREFGPGLDPPNQIYLPIAQMPWLATVLVRTSGDADISDWLRAAVLSLDAQTAITKVQTLDQARANSVAAPRNTARLFGLFAVLALFIAVTGIGSMLALWVRQRRREIGIRMALGAGPPEILFSVIRQGMILVAAGLAMGVAVAVPAAGFLHDFLFQVEPTDVSTYALVSTLILLAAFGACYVPARRAARIDPQSALRCE